MLLLVDRVSLGEYSRDVHVRNDNVSLVQVVPTRQKQLYY